MRLEHLCDMELAYQGDFLLVRPYGGEEGTAFGSGVGTVTGAKLQGSVRWVNHPHRRSDGAMLPDAHGVIQTDDGTVVMFSLRGRTVFTPEGAGRQLLATLFEAEDERYQWLNSTFCVLEGLIDKGIMQARVYACISELA